MHRFRNAAVTALATVLLASCSTFHTAPETEREARSSIGEADALLESIRTGNPAPSAFQVIDNADYVPPKPKRIERAASLPMRCDIEFRPGGPVTLLEVSQKINKDCGFQVRITPDAIDALSSAGSGSANSSGDAGAAPLPPLPLVPSMGGAIGPMASLNYGPRADQISIFYKGDVSGLLNAIAARFGLSWKYSDGGVTIYHLDTRIFRVFSIPTATDVQSTVTSGTTTAMGTSGGAMGAGGASAGASGGVSGEAGTKQSTTVSLTTSPAEDLTRSVESMLTRGKGRAFFSKSNATLTVTDTPEVLDRIALLVDELNANATTQVLLNIKVVSVQLNDSDELGIKWDLIYTNLAQEYGLGLTNGFQNSADAVSGSVSILQGSSRFSGSNLVVNALAKQGVVSMVTQPSVTTLNLEPVPVQVATQTGYVAQTQTTISGGSSDFAQTSRTPGTVTTGFNMNLLPYVLPDAETVLLQFSMQMAAPPTIRSIGDETNLIEIPEVASRTFSQKVKLRSGETLILSGFDQTANRSDKSGVGSPRNWLFGGGRRATHGREVIVVLITPIIQG